MPRSLNHIVWIPEVEQVKKIEAILLTFIVLLMANFAFAYGYGSGKNVYDQGMESSIRDAGRNSLSQDALHSHKERLKPAATQKIPQSVVGNYFCESISSRPCDTKTELRLAGNGSWGWGSSAGQYQVSGNAVRFVSGNGGPVRWGAAVIKADTLTFDGNVLWRKR